MMIGFAVGATPVALVGGAASARPSDVAAVAAGYGTIELPIYIHPAQSGVSHIRLSPLYSSRRIGLQVVATY